MLLWAVIVPVKRVSLAKTRLRDAVRGVSHDDLVLALALDTVVAIRACDRVLQTVVVTDDPVAGPLVARLGATVVPDTPDAGLNAALRHGATACRRVAPEAGIAVVGSDRPALRSEDLAEALDAAGHHDRAFVADAEGTGTALLAAVRDLEPRFGPGSAQRHADSGAVALEGSWASLRHDTDTAADLQAAVSLGVGPHTARLLTAAAQPGPPIP